MLERIKGILRVQLLPLMAGFIILAAIIAAQGLLIQRQRHDNAAVRQAFEFERRIVQTLSLIQDAESAQRGFLLTNEGAYLLPYTRAVQELPAEIEAIRQLAARDPKRASQAAMLSDAVHGRLAELAETIERYNASDAAGALALVRSNRGKVLMDEIRVVIAEMRQDENALLQARIADAGRIADWLRYASIAAVFAVLGLGVFSVVQSRRRIREIVTAHAELTAANKLLSDEIATREEAEARVRQMQKIEAVGQLTGGIAHDFNNMLAIIVSALNLIQRKLARGDTDIGKFLDAAVDGADRAANLTARLLAFSRQQPLAPRTIDANRLVAGMSDLLRRALGESILIETVLAGGLWKTHVDASQLENALLNLAVNARDAMPDGGKLTIETANIFLDQLYASHHSEVPAGQYVLVAVTDTGSGMPPDIVAKAFDPFFTTKTAGKGTGLGLSQIFGFVKQSRGHVAIYSEPGQGTTVKIYLPRHFGDNEEAEPKDDKAEPARKPSETILVVEDDERVRTVTVEALRELGYRVIQAGSAAEALRKLETHPAVSLLFTDIVMPGVSGRKLADQALAAHPGLKTLFTTGFARNAVSHNGLLDHGVNFIAKPFSIEQLARKIREVLDG
ncbi:histidine kinase [Mesorhizobium sp. L-8-10]|uniref:CHASE3 domain-containing protein n=1 Tax=Mesorhizobium sp. L-8-10 TaxID=2744523 RepID=UPI001936F526|nr:CHASE3 domain-containing protein [Mesorhizobium sp. L-8-10]BCH28769.1 histidine kinase [Mesorhizobium sp. L-8-10]